MTFFHCIILFVQNPEKFFTFESIFTNSDKTDFYRFFIDESSLFWVNPLDNRSHAGQNS